MCAGSPLTQPGVFYPPGHGVASWPPVVLFLSNNSDIDSCNFHFRFLQVLLMYVSNLRKGLLLNKGLATATLPLGDLWGSRENMGEKPGLTA